MSVDELMQKIMLAECDGCKKLKWTNELFVNAAVMNGAKLCTICLEKVFRYYNENLRYNEDD